MKLGGEPSQMLHFQLPGGRRAHAVLGRRELHSISMILWLPFQRVLLSSAAQSTGQENREARQLIPLHLLHNHLCMFSSCARHAHKMQAQQRLQLHQAAINWRCMQQAPQSSTCAATLSPRKRQHARLTEVKCHLLPESDRWKCPTAFNNIN